MNNKEWFYLVLFMAVAAAIRLYFLSKIAMVWPDEAYYIRMAQDLVQGRPFGVYRSTYFGQPLVPLLFTLACRIIPDSTKACQITSVIAAVLTLVPFHLCVRTFGNKSEAFWADVAYVLAPFAIQYSLWGMPHAVFNLFFMLCVWFILKAQQTGKYSWCVWTALAVFALYMTRIEAVIFAGILAIAGICTPWLDPKVYSFKRKIRMVGMFSACFIALCLFFWLWVRIRSGVWDFALTFGSGTRGIFMTRLAQDMAEYRTNASLGLMYLCRVGKIYNMVLPRLLPLMLWALVVLGVVEVFSREKSFRRILGVLLFFSAIPILFYALFSLEERRFHLSLICFLLFVGCGITHLTRNISATGIAWRTGVASAVAFALLFLNFFPLYVPLLKGFKEEPLEQKRLGEWIQRHIDSPQIILGSDRRVAFYAGSACRKFISFADTKIAIASMNRFEDYLAKEGIDLVVADTRYIPKYSPEFLFLLHADAIKNLRPIASFFEGPEKIILYQRAS